MAKSASIRTFQDVDRIQRSNESRFEHNSRETGILLNTIEQSFKSMDELKAVVAKTSRDVADLSQKVAETSISMDELKAIVAETTKGIAEFKVEMAEHRKSEKRRSKEMDRRIANLGKQIGYIHNSHGEFVEHMASGSIKNIVENQFKAKYRGNFLYSVDKTTLEIDAWGTRGKAADTEVFVFEIKKKFDRKAVKQLHKQIATLRSIQLSYSTCPIYPFIASAVISEEDAKWVWDQGIYLLKFGNKIFEFDDAPKGFQPNYKIGIPPPKGPRRVERMVPPPPPRFVRELRNRTSALTANASLH